MHLNPSLTVGPHIGDVDQGTLLDESRHARFESVMMQSLSFDHRGDPCERRQSSCGKRGLRVHASTIVEAEQSADPLPALDRRIAAGRIASAARPTRAAGCRHLGGPLAMVTEWDCALLRVIASFKDGSVYR